MFRSEVLSAALTEEQRQQGFSLEEEEDFVNLLHKGKVVAVFCSIAVTIATIRQEADKLTLKYN